MKKLFFVVALGAFVACNSGTSTEEKTDSTVEAQKENIDSAANAQINAIDSSAEAQKAAIDSTTTDTTTNK